MNDRPRDGDAIAFGPESEFDEALDAVLATDPGDRVPFIERAFGDRPELGERLISLLSRADAASGLLEQAGRAAQALLTEDDSASPAEESKATGASPSTETSAREGPPETLPERVGNYRILEWLGSGGMGTVYLAELIDGELDRRIALKVVTGAAHSPRVRRRFLEERKILGRLEHPGIARLYDVGVDDAGTPYFAMEKVDGDPIDMWADRRRLSVDDRVRLVLQVADALACAHRNLVVHRDVKPGNLLVTDDGQVKLLDFGVAKLLEEPEDEGRPPLTRPGLPVLTPEYASPEQIRGEAVTTASDVYATGVLLFELLVGTRPYSFTSRSPAEIERIVADQRRRRPSEAAHGVSPETAAARRTTPAALARALSGDLDAIVLKALQTDPGQRYGSIQELATDLRRVQAHVPVAARAPTWGYRARRFVRRQRLPLAGGVATLFALLLGLGATWWQGRIAAREAERAERVVELLAGLFEGADPDIAGGQELSARELLSRGERTLLAGLEGEPEIATRLRELLGRIYTDLGEYDRARPLLDSALAGADRHGDVDERASIRATLGELYLAEGRYAEGEVTAREELELRQGASPGGSTDLATALTNLAAFVNNQGRYEEAESLLREGLAMDRRLGATENVAADLNNLGVLLRNQGRYDEAIEALSESTELRRSINSGDHTDVATSMANLGFALDSKGNYERADSFYDASLEMRRRLLGEEHPLVAMVLNNKAGLRQRQGRLTESRELHERALAIRRSVFGDEHLSVAASLNNIAVVSYREGDLPAAEANMREALRIFRANQAEDHPNVLTGVSNLGAVLMAMRNFGEAEQLIRETLETRAEVLGSDHHQTGGSWNVLADLLRQQGRLEEADEASQRAVRIFRSALDPAHPDLASGLFTRGMVLVELDRGSEWVDQAREGCDSTRTRYEDDHPSTARCRAVLGLALLHADQSGEARTELAAAVPVLEEHRPDDPWTLRAREALDRLSGS
ncbi:MAG: serine/threonine protein kinase [Gemmatimonadetes bacterium]|nr:serine/threonine protein kinase [Gemmatimonadota bacterium]